MSALKEYLSGTRHSEGFLHFRKLDQEKDMREKEVDSRKSQTLLALSHDHISIIWVLA